jgi:hypothetical protein
MDGNELPQLLATLKTGEEQFHRSGHPLERQNTLNEFWRWAGSDLVDNTFRGWLAEFIVASALGLTEGIRDSWGVHDLIMTSPKLTIQVKCSAYLQSWLQGKYSDISFDIKPKRAWNPATGKLEGPPKRHSDIYIFCIHQHKDKHSVDPMDLDQWVFYVLRTQTLDEKFPEQKKLPLSSLLALQPLKANYQTLKPQIDQWAPQK